MSFNRFPSPPISAVTSVNGQTGVVVLTTSDIAEGTNLYFTTARVAGYALLAGRAGGQVLNGGTAASETLTLHSTANATKGNILFGTSAYDEVNNRLGIGTTTPDQAMTVVGEIHVSPSGSPGRFISFTVAGHTMGMNMYAGIQIDFLGENNPFLQFYDETPNSAQILARVNRHLVLGCDTTDATRGVRVRGSSGQTAKFLIVEDASLVEAFSVSAAGQATFTTTTGALTIPRMTTTQKNALTGVNGMMVYDSTLDKFQGYQGGSWTSFA